MYVDVKFANYRFRFRQLHWREDFNIKFPPKKDPFKVILANALEEVSGLKINSLEEAYKVVDAIPPAISTRLFKIFKGSLPPSRHFVTAGLYKAPDPSSYIQRVEEAEVQVESVVEKTVKQMESKFGKKELDEAREVDRLILEGARKKDGKGYRGAVEVTE